MDSSIAQIIPDIILRETGVVPSRIFPIKSAGLVNSVYEAQTSQATFIVRLNGDEDAYRIYLKEKWCIEQTRPLGIPGPESPRVGTLGAVDYSLYPKIKGIVASQMSGNRDFIWRRLGEYARKFHQIPAYGFGSGFGAEPDKGASVSDWLNYYLDYIFDNDRLVEEQIVKRKDWLRSRRAIEDIRHWDISPHLCHGNLVLKNVIISDGDVPDGTIRDVHEDRSVVLIDWGTACGHLAPQIDLTEILVEHPDDRRGLAMFLEGYGLSQPEFRAMKEQLWVLQVWRMLSIVKWALQGHPSAVKEIGRYKQQLEYLFSQ